MVLAWLDQGIGDILTHAVVAGILASIACGLGALPWAIKGLDPKKHAGTCYAFAGGLMFSASVYNLILPGLELGESGWTLSHVLPIIAGFLGGAMFLAMTDRFLDHSPTDLREGRFSAWGGRVGLLVFFAMAVHSIPEGLAVSIPLRSAGMSIPRCFLAATLTSVPQPIAAILAVLLAWFFAPLMPLLMGFAVGAMIFLVVLELIPEALETETPSHITWAFTFGFCAMLLIQVVL